MRVYLFCSSCVKAYNREMSEDTIKIWKLKAGGAIEIDLPDLTSLDAITRNLPQGFYTTFRTYDQGRRVLGLRAHLQRLYQPATAQQIGISAPGTDLRRILADLLRRYPGEARVRLTMTLAGQVYIAIEPLKPLPLEIYARGVKVISAGVERQNPRLKSTDFISASQSVRNNISGSSAFEALLVRNGYILEGMTSNFFYIIDGRLGTARRNVLLGVTRRTVLRVARGRGLPIIYKPLKLEQVPELAESFLTSSSRGIVPIIQIDASTVGEGAPGRNTVQLIEAYQAYVLQHAEKINPA